ncbi:mycofactocin-coupled SDR family oxidoreductase [Gordonia McavH-238-E]|uniref:mycofactocin-coupled SDR family oxidoreductase n=1 Tax=Gordonia sp. McavH-238-E TaxID=2917736 RepID=UPI001EF53079|nr:mycofactocin-coupled SDR family oxidoreductase [Gordonia sp. McavH-238-E]MCG7632809.1 mycofactocin-coupled SDR family oxidoreductase [Gordonia sp. McavH-238-E]
MGQLDGMVAYITGAARGQGRNHAIHLARQGADIIAVDIAEQVTNAPYPTATADDMAQTVREVEALDRRIIAAEADVRDLDALHQAAERGVDAFGRIDIVLANAGISAPAPTLDMTEQAWSEMIDINLTGVWKTIKAAVPHVRAGGRGGSVVITSSLAAMHSNPNIAHYAAAKAGLVGLMHVLAKELAPENIRVNTIHPTTVATDMVLNDPTYRLFRPELPNPTKDDFIAAASQLNALPIPLTDVDDISAAVLYLVCPSGRAVTGITHMVDAGGAL